MAVKQSDKHLQKPGDRIQMRLLDENPFFYNAYQIGEASALAYLVIIRVKNATLDTDIEKPIVQAIYSVPI